MGLEDLMGLEQREINRLAIANRIVQELHLDRERILQVLVPVSILIDLI